MGESNAEKKNGEIKPDGGNKDPSNTNASNANASNVNASDTYNLKKAKKPINKKVLTAMIMALFLIITGTFCYHLLEGWSFIDSVYFTAVTLTTIGYGDIYPITDTGKIFTVFFVFAGVGTFLFSLTIIAEYVFMKRMDSVNKGFEDLKQNLDKLGKATPLPSDIVKHTVRHTKRHLKRLGAPMRKK
jgi:voltage-gated potassium channel